MPCGTEANDTPRRTCPTCAVLSRWRGSRRASWPSVFQEEVITLRETGDRGPDVVLIHRGDDDGIAHFRELDELVPRLEHSIMCQAVNARELVSIRIAWLGDRDDFGEVRRVLDDLTEARAPTACAQH